MLTQPVTPQNEAAELAVIGSMLMGASPYAAPIRSEHFHGGDNRLVFDAIRALADKSQPVNVSSVTSHLTAQGLLEHAGGPVARYLSPDVAAGKDTHVRHFFTDLEAARRNREAVTHIYRHLSDLSAMRVDAADFAAQLAEVAAPVAVSTCGDSAAEILDRINARILNGEPKEVFPFGLGPLDRHLSGGLHRGELGVIAGNTGDGKSAVLIQAAAHNAEAERKVRYFTLELPDEDIFDRMACALRGTTMRNERAWNSARFDLGNMPLWVHQQFTELSEIAAEIRTAVRSGNCDIAIVDYIQRVGIKADTRELEVATIARTLKTLALRENIPVITASQLNDNGQLRESRAIGHEADFVMTINEEGLHVDKCRRGPRDVLLPCHLLGAQSRFVATSKDRD
jgi:replicative DNA helicase